jgi:hypothetical protein
MSNSKLIEDTLRKVNAIHEYVSFEDGFYVNQYKNDINRYKGAYDNAVDELTKLKKLSKEEIESPVTRTSTYFILKEFNGAYDMFANKTIATSMPIEDVKFNPVKVQTTVGSGVFRDMRGGDDNDSRLSETSDSRLSETSDSRLSETSDSRLSETSDSQNTNARPQNITSTEILVGPTAAAIIALKHGKKKSMFKKLITLVVFIICILALVHLLKELLLVSDYNNSHDSESDYSESDYSFV